MTTAALQTILDRIATWPPEQQEEAMDALAMIEGRGHLGVSDADAAEIERRVADVNAPKLTLDEFEDRMRRLGP